MMEPSKYIKPDIWNVGNLFNNTGNELTRNLYIR